MSRINSKFNKQDVVRFIRNIERFDLEEVKSLLKRERISDEFECFADKLTDATTSFCALEKIYDFFFENSTYRRRSLDEIIEYLSSSTGCNQTEKDYLLLRSAFENYEDFSDAKTVYDDMKRIYMIFLVEKIDEIQRDCQQEKSAQCVNHIIRYISDIVNECYVGEREELRSIEQVYEVCINEDIEFYVSKNLLTLKEGVEA
jgi:hypothetical protein